MKIYENEGSHLFCGHWNGSPIEIGMGHLSGVPAGEVRHMHPYHEYYVMLEGMAELELDGRIVPIKAGQVAMVEPGEWHQIISIGSEKARWIIIKERSLPNSKIVDVLG